MNAYLVYIQFHWQFFITYSGFLLINILLRKFDTYRNKNDKDKFFYEKQQQLQKNVKKVCRFIFFLIQEQ